MGAGVVRSRTVARAAKIIRELLECEDLARTVGVSSARSNAAVSAGKRFLREHSIVYTPPTKVADSLK
jgi:hypothetical protein